MKQDEPIEVYERAYPFCMERKKWIYNSARGCEEQRDTWYPGYQENPWGGGLEANGVGKVQYAVISRHKPGRYPTRIFYTRTWIDPDGRTFGKSGLRMCTVNKFNRLCAIDIKDFRIDAPANGYDLEKIYNIRIKKFNNETVYCPKCGTECSRQSIHNGFCYIYGPWGCPECRWSEDSRFDSSEGERRIDGLLVDQYGMGHPGK